MGTNNINSAPDKLVEELSPTVQGTKSKRATLRYLYGEDTTSEGDKGVFERNGS